MGKTVRDAFFDNIRTKSYGAFSKGIRCSPSHYYSLIMYLYKVQGSANLITMTNEYLHESILITINYKDYAINHKD